jgi:2-methylisocitrate lyase-like PEP mutase family enzyme
MPQLSNDHSLTALINRHRPLLVPGVANALSALVAADIGFDALYVTGAGVSNFVLGVPDIGLISLADLAEVTTGIAGVVDLPLIVDADTGFGNAVNVYHAVRRLEQAGASAIQLEDQLFPKKCGHFDGKAVTSKAEMIDKVRSAVDARRSANTLIVARTDAAAIHGFEDAIDRAHAYHEAGADILFVEALTTADQMLEAPRRLGNVPQIINIVHGGKTPPLPLAELGAAGYAIALYANAALQAAVAGMQKVLGVLHRTGSLAGMESNLADFAERQRLVRKPHYDALERRYAPADR